MVRRPSRRSGSSRETLTEVRNRLRDPLKGQEVVGRLSRRSGSGRHLGGPEVVGRPSRRYGSGWETLPDVWM